ncbi:hypothetical protein [Candidatus Enterococcus murrayae]|uniref:SPOR domain-containing protein n=1 Tax=Candidatus Enterococcus murrayae TaxID=2815321 RepID=A0ABS3HBC7_9ENTE|nr:hypothetical protein [Enterococcus sp. MJM16]MBO0450776.1 hypothetical protein [Enterococcus sp. MJM16]
MEELRNWNVQVLDVNGNVKFQASVYGNEKEARSLLKTFEDKYWRKKNA